MSFQAYLDNIEDKTGTTPDELLAMAKEKGYDDPDTLRLGGKSSAR